MFNAVADYTKRRKSVLPGQFSTGYPETALIIYIVEAFTQK